jgi:streptogramin lyase
MRRALSLIFGVLFVVASPAAQSGFRARLVVGEGLNEPFAVDFDGAGRMFIAEMGGNRVSVWDRQAGLTPQATPFNGPHHLITGPHGDIYVADTWAHIVRRVDPATGVVTRVAGTGQKGFSGDGGPALDAQFGAAFSIAIHDAILYIADLDNRRIRSVSLTSGLVGTVAGNGNTGVPVDGADAKTQPLVDPRAVAVDASGQIYNCERGGHALRVVDTVGRIRSVAGTGEPGAGGDGGPALKAALRGPKHISIDTDGSVLIADTENHMIRRYVPSSGTIERVAGTGQQGAAGLDGPPDQLQLNRPHGATRHAGALYISDSENHRVVAID